MEICLLHPELALPCPLCCSTRSCMLICPSALLSHPFSPCPLPPVHSDPPDLFQDCPMPCPGSPLLSDVPKNFPGSHSSRWSTETCSQPAQLPPRADFHPLAVPTSNLTSAFLQTQPTALARLHLLPPVLPLDPGQGRLCLQQSRLCRTSPRGRCRWAAPSGMAHVEPPLKELSHVPSACTLAGLPG